MAIAFDTITQVNTEKWQFDWSESDTWNVYLDGILLSTTTDNTYTIEQTGASAISPALEVMSSSSVADNVKYPPRIVLQWQKSDNTQTYNVQEYVSSAWKTRQRIRNKGSRYFSFQTFAMTDVTSNQWRVIPVNKFAVEGTPLLLTTFLVRNPAPPQAAITYANPDVTVSAI